MTCHGFGIHVSYWLFRCCKLQFKVLYQSSLKFIMCYDQCNFVKGLFSLLNVTQICKFVFFAKMEMIHLRSR